MTKNHQVILAKRPLGMPDESNLTLTAVPMPESADGQVLVQNVYLSLDPYMRGRIAIKSRRFCAARNLLGGYAQRHELPD